MSAESIDCIDCGNPTPKVTYATTRCPACFEAWNWRRIGREPQSANHVAIKRPAAEPVVTAPQQPDTPAVAVEPNDEYDSKTERRYAEKLEADRIGGLILSWMPKPFKLRLARKTYYAPDFLVLTLGRAIELHEVKGSWKAPHQEDARVKIKCAAEKFPMFRFVAVVPDKGGWSREEF